MKMRFTKWDLLPIVAVVALAAAVFMLFLPSNTAPDCVQVYQNGQLLTSLPLAEDATYTVEGNYTNVVTVKDGKVAVTESNCPGGDCEKCGWFDTAGSIVCLPNGVEVRILSRNGDVDIVVG